MIGTEDPDDLMMEIIDVLEEGEKTPEAGEFYVFVYNPKTPNIRYDQNPLVAVTAVYPWGFKGINFHWGEARQYTWSEIAGGEGFFLATKTDGTLWSWGENNAGQLGQNNKTLNS